jgi:hypothetical protein
MCVCVCVCMYVCMSVDCAYSVDRTGSSPLYVSAYHYMCPKQPLLYMCPYLSPKNPLLYMCPHTTMLCSYHYMCPKQPLLYMCPHTTMRAPPPRSASTASTENSEALSKALDTGTRFTCFTGTKVQILTQRAFSCF